MMDMDLPDAILMHTDPTGKVSIDQIMEVEVMVFKSELSHSESILFVRTSLST